MLLLPSQVSAGFRFDINGLRAWAVALVVLYHFGVSGVGGGFIGVDVFFVISGFLMTSIILAGLESKRFSVMSFYLARARRIFPALMVLVAALMLLGWFLLLPEEYEQLGKHAYKSLLFTSNQTYLSEAGYFDSASHEKWLLHTWSLSVEWQFYVLQPLLFIGLWKVLPGRRSIAVVTALMLIVSLVACITVTASEPSAAFYLLWTRAWEMLLGGMVFLLTPYFRASKAHRAWLECLGFTLIYASALLFDARTQWPGWHALIPTLGAGLVLLAANQSSIFTRSRIVQWLGTRSYSIYLWHWPLVVALVYMERLANPLWVIGGLLLVAVLGDQSYRWVEVPARDRVARLSRKHALLALVLALLVCLIPARLIRSNDGYAARVSAPIARIDGEKKNYNKRRSECELADAKCIFGGRQVAAIMLGDSHAVALVSGLAAAIPDRNQGVLLRAASGCHIGFTKRLGATNDDCTKLNRDVERSLATEYQGVPVVLVTRTARDLFGGLPGEEDAPYDKPEVFISKRYDSYEPAYFAELKQDYVRTACSIAEHHPLYIVRPIAEMGHNVPATVARGMMWGKERAVFVSLKEYHARQAFVWSMQDAAQAQCGAVILNPLPYLCDSERCLGTHNGQPIYFDDDHLSESGNRLLTPMFSEVFKTSLGV